MTAVGLATPIVLVILGWWLVRNVDAHHVGPLGLIELLPVPFFLVCGLLGTSFLWHLRRASTSSVVLGAHMVALVVLFHGTVSWIEQSPRFPVAYTHLGFIDIIQRHDEAVTWLDARMSWPGFFAMGAVLDKVAGTSSAYDFLLWAPLVTNLLYAPLLFSIARTTTDDRRVPWLATWTFFSASWVGQDYFAPQALNFLLFLAFTAVLLRIFRTDHGSLPARLRFLERAASRVVRTVLRAPRLRPGGTETIPTMPGQRVALIAAMLVLFAASVVSHQLTPFSIFLNVLILVVIGRTQLRGMPLALLAIVFTYISYGAVAYWSGHLDQIFGGFGQVGGTVQQNVGNRVQVSSNHVDVIYGRLAFTGLIWATAALGVLRRLRKGKTDLALLVCMFSPFLVLGGQSYGGEAILRVFLFTLPFASVFCALALLPDRTTPFGNGRFAFTVALAFAVVPVFVLARYGNEAFEYIPKAEYVAARRLYELAPEGSTLVAVDPNAAWKIERVDEYEYLPSLDDFDLANVDQIYKEMTQRPNHDSFLYVSRAQIQATSLRTGRPRDWDVELTERLVASGKFKVAYENKDARIFTLTGKH